MVKRILLRYSNIVVSRWIILLIDILAVTGLFFFAYLVRFNFVLRHVGESFYPVQVFYIIGIYTIGFILFRSYSGMIRHTTLIDTIKIVSSISFSALLVASTTWYVQTNFTGHQLNIPFSVILIHYLLCAFILVNTRVLLKMAYLQISTSRNIKNMMVYGAGNLGLITKQTFTQSNASKYQVIGFIDDNPSIQKKMMEGIKVYSPLRVFRESFIQKEKLDTIVIAINHLPVEKKRKITDLCLRFGIEVRIVPPVEDWFNGELSVGNINNLRIEDILGRESIVLDLANISQGIKNQTILITGAAGSIGSEIVRQILTYEPQRLILYDQAETPLHDLQLEIQQRITNKEVHFIVGDINNRERLIRLFNTYKPHIVFHAAAYKHVPMMEANPGEALRVNVGGTRNLADLSVQYGVQRFVMISTDKAVNPTSIMGASKRIAELYTQGLSAAGVQTKFIITRFGNVLGSNGSVIPLFKKQIEQGGPVTVTHPEITRYFMTIPEACQLVLEAAFMGDRGEIFIFDMGESVKIIDLADKMIRLAGKVPGQDIKIEITGLRPGEKLYEELLANKENTKPTHHPKIMIGNFQTCDFEAVNREINYLLEHCETMQSSEIIAAVKAIVPEYRSA